MEQVFLSSWNAIASAVSSHFALDKGDRTDPSISPHGCENAPDSRIRHCKRP